MFESALQIGFLPGMLFFLGGGGDKIYFDANSSFSWVKTLMGESFRGIGNGWTGHPPWLAPCG